MINNELRFAFCTVFFIHGDRERERERVCASLRLSMKMLDNWREWEWKMDISLSDSRQISENVFENAVVLKWEISRLLK